MAETKRTHWLNLAAPVLLLGALACVPLTSQAAHAAGRAALVFVRQEPRVVLVERKYIGHGTDHGTVYSYDRRVPFIISGPGVRRGLVAAPVDVRDVAPSIAFLLGVPPPDACQGRPVPSVGR